MGEIYDFLALKTAIEEKVEELVDIKAQIKNIDFSGYRINKIDFDEYVEVELIFEPNCYCCSNEYRYLNFKYDDLINDDWIEEEKEKLRLKKEQEEIAKKEKEEMQRKLKEEKERKEFERLKKKFEQEAK